MSASYPKPDSERLRPAARSFTWVDLPPAGRVGRAPSLPAWRLWHPKTREWRKELWRSPQATQWMQDGSTLAPFALLMDDVISGKAEVVKASAEIRQHQDRHGFNPKSMLQLRWRLAEKPTVQSRPRRSAADLKAKLRIVEGDEELVIR